MQARKYQTLVSRLELEAHRNPGRFRAMVLILSLSAYLLLFILLTALVAASVWMFQWVWESRRLVPMLSFGGWMLTIIPVVFLTLRMFLVRLEAPRGRPVTAAEAPHLFKLLGKIRKRLKAPPIHRVLITNDFNAAIAQRPRFGLFGGYRNYLILGLPYLHAMSPQEILAVIAHEYGHLTGSHGKLSAWIYRQRLTFGALHAHAEIHREEDVVNSLFFSLLDTIAPYYNAYTFVLSRQNEYDADRVAGRIAGMGANASGLVRSALLGDWLHKEFWPRFYTQARKQATPGYLPYSAMRKIFAASQPEWATLEKLHQFWEANSDLYDTHPCLRERVEAMGQERELPPPVSRSAAETLLGSLASTLSKEFDGAWWREHQAEWRECHRRYHRTFELEKLSLDEMEDSDLQEFALLLLEFRTPAHAKPVLRHLLKRPRGPYSKARLLLGRILLNEGNSQGLEYLEEACRTSPSLAEDCLRAGYEWLLGREGEKAAEDWVERVGGKA